jgi:formylglycine-generating enzyme required for sulfatase activity
VDRWVYQLEIEKGYEQLRSIQSLGVSKDLVSDALLEFAFWYGETGELPRAWGILDTAYALSGRRLIAQGPKDLAGLRTALRDLDGQRYSFLQARYFPEMVAVKGGEFTMGSEQNDDEKPAHRVVVADFQMGATEVTWWQYGLYAAAEQGNGVEMPDSPGWGIAGDNPVVHVSWYDAVQYANWLNEKKGMTAYYDVDKARKDPGNTNEYDDLKWTVRPRGSKGYRLPTEAEWEYAARGGKQQEWAGTDSEDTLGDFAWYAANSGSRTRPVRGKRANALGLYDMSGNVWEWCWDWYGDYQEEAKDNPVGPSEGTFRVLRGGSWFSYAGYCRSALRSGSNPGYRDASIGFRLVFVP